jgi:hypothetical protein
MNGDFGDSCIGRTPLFINRKKGLNLKNIIKKIYLKLILRLKKIWLNK